MAEQTIRADQIEGLAELIQAQIKTAMQIEGKPDLQNVDEVRRSPAGTLIRLEGKIDALKDEMDQRFQAVDQRFDDLKSEINQRFQAVDQRFDALKTEMDQRFDALGSEINHRFDAQDGRLKLFQWIIILMFSLLIAMAGKLFTM